MANSEWHLQHSGAAAEPMSSGKSRFTLWLWGGWGGCRQKRLKSCYRSMESTEGLRLQPFIISIIKGFKYEKKQPNLDLSYREQQRMTTLKLPAHWDWEPKVLARSKLLLSRVATQVSTIAFRLYTWNVRLRKNVFSHRSTNRLEADHEGEMTNCTLCPAGILRHLSE